MHFLLLFAAVSVSILHSHCANAQQSEQYLLQSLSSFDTSLPATDTNPLPIPTTLSISDSDAAVGNSDIESIDSNDHLNAPFIDVPQQRMDVNMIITLFFGLLVSAFMLSLSFATVLCPNRLEPLRQRVLQCCQRRQNISSALVHPNVRSSSLSDLDRLSLDSELSVDDERPSFVAAAASPLAKAAQFFKYTHFNFSNRHLNSATTQSQQNKAVEINYLQSVRSAANSPIPFSLQSASTATSPEQSPSNQISPSSSNSSLSIQQLSPIDSSANQSDIQLTNNMKHRKELSQTQQHQHLRSVEGSVSLVQQLRSKLQAR